MSKTEVVPCSLPGGAGGVTFQEGNNTHGHKYNTTDLKKCWEGLTGLYICDNARDFLRVGDCLS